MEKKYIKTYLSEELTGKLRRAAAIEGVSLSTFSAMILTKAVIETRREEEKREVLEDGRVTKDDIAETNIKIETLRSLTADILKKVERVDAKRVAVRSVSVPTVPVRPLPVSAQPVPYLPPEPVPVPVNVCQPRQPIDWDRYLSVLSVPFLIVARALPWIALACIVGGLLYWLRP